MKLLWESSVVCEFLWKLCLESGTKSDRLSMTGPWGCSPLPPPAGFTYRPGSTLCYCLRGSYFSLFHYYVQYVHSEHYRPRTVNRTNLAASDSLHCPRQTKPDSAWWTVTYIWHRTKTASLNVKCYNSIDVLWIFWTQFLTTAVRTPGPVRHLVNICCLRRMTLRYFASRRTIYLQNSKTV